MTEESEHKGLELNITKIKSVTKNETNTIVYSWKEREKPQKGKDVPIHEIYNNSGW